MTRDDPTSAERLGRLRAVAPGELRPGEHLGEYVVEGRIASGGSGTVYAVLHGRLGRRAAIKVLHPELASSPAMVERFLREARVVSQIGHANLVDIYEIGQLADGRPYLVMEFLIGSTLAAILDQRGRLRPDEALDYLEPVGAALGAAHRAGVIHRDLKASNVVVLSEEHGLRVKLLDFGIAKLLEPRVGETRLTAVGQRLGTPHAMAPEQVRGTAVDERTDIYGLGVLLFHMLTGGYPFNASDLVELERMQLEMPPPRPSRLAPLSPDLDDVVLRCLEKDPARRPPSVEAVLDAFRSAVRPSVRTELEPAHERPAVGIYVEVRPNTPSDEDDELFAKLAVALEAIEQRLAVEEFALHLLTGSVILGVRLLGDGTDEDRQGRGAALRLARELAAGAALRDPRLSYTIQVHTAPAIWRAGPGGPTIVGGAITETGAWVLDGVAGMHATPTLRAGVDEEEVGRGRS